MRNVLALFAMAAAMCGATLYGQLPGGTQKLSPSTVQVYRFAREFKEQKFPINDIGMPDELRVTTTDKIHIAGKKREQKAEKRNGKVVGHVGKLALIPVGKYAGKVSIKIAPIEGAIYYYASLEKDDGSLDTEIVPFVPGKMYDWSVVTSNGQTTFEIVDGQTKVSALSGPSDKIKSFGFAATVRNQGNEADLTATVE